MHTTQTLTLGNESHIAYKQLNFGSKVSVVFLGGFMSNMNSTKASAVFDYCAKHNLNCTIFDYFGNGDSSGRFEDYAISDWKQNCCQVIESLVAPSTPIVLVGSSMGGWLAFLVAMHFPTRVKGVVGIAAAPDFTESIELSEQHRETLASTGSVENCKGERVYTITQRLLLDGKNHLLLKGEIPVECPITLIHGMDDVVVPFRDSIALAENVVSTDVNIHLIKSGDHHLCEQPILDGILEKMHCMVRKVESTL
ncbi:alpha/beta hydrolase [Candidatus Anaplasma sp. TIGMIC]|uniref:alpha/beta hydrolase n=1 Tax=Candidatus Anaplasma sp. TIGMIC TaxID=3020713 RepID=UPI00232FFAA5|nr:alpha/beta hydrolase [Candidatus Anaplasma sp. TIGMIC]MDB1135539.1 alpha/beta hydrolase [Candidatus Anaplasma sp. TIGMIC]